MQDYTAHVDTFARDRLPPRELWPEFRFDLPEFNYPARTNCARVLLDDAINDGCAARIALRGEDDDWSYAQLAEETNRLANVLVRDLGVVPGNRVLLRARNSPMLVCAWLAVVKAGAIAVTTMPMLRSKELAAIAERARIDHALCQHDLRGELQAASANGWLRRIRSWDGGELEHLMAMQSTHFAAVDTAVDDVCLLAFTSGTTGVPKATMHFHRDVLAMADTVGGRFLGTRPGDIYAGSPPLGFTFGLGALLVLPLRFRGCGVMIERPTPELLLRGVQEHRATTLFTAPTMYRQLTLIADQYDLSSLRTCVSAGEPLPRSTSDEWHAATGIRLTDGIGATEMIHIFIGSTGTDVRPGATGKPLAGYQACVLDANGTALPNGSTGRLAVKGPTGCRYLDDPRQRDYVVNGWNVTGDIYHVDRDGYFWFQCRTDDMIVSSGYNIAGPEVEAALALHPAVKECAVIGVPDAARGQIVKAFVVLHRGASADASMTRVLQDFVKSSIAPYKYPRAIGYIPELPRTPSGKVQRHALRTI
ncbi:MAG TPA: AMP-binding protein [Steroidobacteraceae bacterium]|jgi:2-aminobenzoate-CoA ligase